MLTLLYYWVILETFLYCLFVVCPIFPWATYLFNDLNTSVLHWTAVLFIYLFFFKSNCICCWWAKQSHCTCQILILSTSLCSHKVTPLFKIWQKTQMPVPSMLSTKWWGLQITQRENGKWDTYRLDSPGFPLLMIISKFPTVIVFGRNRWWVSGNGGGGWMELGHLGVWGWKQEAHV